MVVETPAGVTHTEEENVSQRIVFLLDLSFFCGVWRIVAVGEDHQPFLVLFLVNPSR